MRVAKILESAIGIDLCDEFIESFLCLIVVNLAGAGGMMAASAVFEHQLADVGFAAPVKNRLACGKNGVLLLYAPHDMD